ncbi:hypothetical protein PMI10_02770 [Flavobacterium sp. CF136]|nr:hypothetical protein PMI10_02770 [Flavobacterium sp. CF136]
MYEQQQIITINLFDGSTRELSYLKSNSLLIESDRELQFFHQTFYDYTFSRQFVESKKSLEKYIKENSQSLYVRSVIKMVIEYYREYDHKEYIRLLRVLVTSASYRFHLKTLVISSFATIKKPTADEMNIASKYILPNFNYAQLFISEVHSSGWFNFLLDKDVPSNYFLYSEKWYHRLYKKLVLKKIISVDYWPDYNYKKQSTDRVTLNLRLFVSNSKDNIEAILNYLIKIPEFEGKQNFMEHFLTDIDHWDNPKLLPLFDIYLAPEDSDTVKDNFWFYHTLEKIIVHDPIFVFNKIKKIILRDFDEDGMFADFSHDQVTLFEKINEIHPDKSFDFFFEIYNSVAEETRFAGSYEEVGSVLYDSYTFSSDIEDAENERADFFLQKVLVNYIKSKVKDYPFFITFFNKYKNSDSVSILKILILGLLEYTELYKKEILDLIKIIYLKNGFSASDDKFQFYLRNLISKSISMYDSYDKEKIVEILLSVKDPHEMYSFSGKESRNEFGSYYGKKKYLFLDILPKTERNSFPVLKKTHMELQRRFPDLQIREFRNNRVRWSVVGAPLPSKAYDNMKMQDWKKTILKYGDTYIRKRNSHSSEGGKTEHCRAFGDAVTSNPEKFYPFLAELLKDNNVSADYLASGIEALIKSNFDTEMLHTLYKQHISRKLDSVNSLHAVRNIDYFINHKSVDAEIMTFLCELLLSVTESNMIKNSKDLLNASLNSLRGAAAHRIIKCSYDYSLQEQIFSTLEQITEDPDDSVIAAILYNLAYLNNFNLERSFKIFLKLIDTDNLEILKNAFRPASYFRNKYYEEMKPFFNKIIENEELHKDGGILIALNWFSGFDKDKICFNKFMSKSSTAKLEILRTAEANIFTDGQIDVKCLDVFFHFLEGDKEFSSAYAGFVLRKFKRSNFKVLLPFMKKYAQSEVYNNEPRYFLQYLLKCSKDYPIECLDLVRKMNFKRVPNVQQRGRYDSEPVQLILSIYSSLNNHFKNNKKQIEVSLNIFDSMMKLDHLRFSANNALDKL